VHPYLFEIPFPWGGSFRIASYGFMVMCGFLICVWLLERRGKALGLDPSALLDTALATLLGGLVGARLYYVVYDWGSFRGNLWQIVRIDRGGLVFYGGLMGGAAALLLMIYRKKLPLRRTLDLAVGLLPLGHAFGRMGCFLNGCCFGGVTSSFVGLRFPRILAHGHIGNPLFDVGDQTIVGCPVFIHQLLTGQVDKSWTHSLPVHPTQLYAVGYNLAIFAVLSFHMRRRWREGDVAWLYGILYGCARFINEILREDQPPVLAGLTMAQVICVPLILFCAVMLVMGRFKEHQPLPEPWQPPAQQDERRQP